MYLATLFLGTEPVDEIFFLRAGDNCYIFDSKIDSLNYGSWFSFEAAQTEGLRGYSFSDIAFIGEIK